MKFIIKTSAVGVSDKKSVSRGEYVTEDQQEIERLREIAKRFPDDIEEVKGKPESLKQNTAKKEEDEDQDEDQTPKNEPKKADGKPAQITKK